MTAPKPSLAQGVADALNALRQISVPAVDLAAEAAVWISPAFPAIYTWHGVTYNLLGQSKLTWDVNVAFWGGAVIAACVELVGMASVYTVVSLRSDKDRSLFWLAGVSCLFYVAIVVLGNAGLGWLAGEHGIRIAVSALLSCLTLVGAIIAGVRGEVSKRAAEADKRTGNAVQLNAQAFDQGTQRIHTQNSHEMEVLKLRQAHDERMAKIAHGIDPDAQPAPVIDPASTGQLASVKPELAALVAEFRARNATSKSSSRDLCRYLHELAYSNTEIAVATGIHISGVGKHINSSKNGAKA